jgi:hypothetical protein
LLETGVLVWNPIQFFLLSELERAGFRFSCSISSLRVFAGKTTFVRRHKSGDFERKYIRMFFLFIKYLKIYSLERHLFFKFSFFSIFFHQ